MACSKQQGLSIDLVRKSFKSCFVVVSGRPDLNILFKNCFPVDKCVFLVRIAKTLILLCCSQVNNDSCLVTWQKCVNFKCVLNMPPLFSKHFIDSGQSEVTRQSVICVILMRMVRRQRRARFVITALD